MPEYQPRGDTKALARYVTRCRRLVKNNVAGTVATASLDLESDLINMQNKYMRG